MSTNLILPIFFCVIGGIFIFFAITTFINTRTFIANAQNVTGKVVRLVYKRSSDGSSSYSPVFQFRTISGQMVEVEDSLSSSPPMYDEGDNVEVLYDPANPQEAKIKKFSSLYFVTMIFGFMGSLFAVIGVWVLLVQLNK